LCKEERGEKWQLAVFFPIVLLNPFFYFMGPDCRNTGDDSAAKYPRGYTTLDLAIEVKKSDYEHYAESDENEIIKLLKKYGAKTSKELL
jgi:hypothetical protein